MNNRNLFDTVPDTNIQAFSTGKTESRTTTGWRRATTDFWGNADVDAVAIPKTVVALLCEMIKGITPIFDATSDKHET